MPALTFPPHPTRQNYVVTPWIDPSGSPWIWNQTKLRWREQVVVADKQPLDADLTAIAALTTTAHGRSLLTSADAAASRAAIGAGTSNMPAYLALTAPPVDGVAAVAASSLLSIPGGLPAPGATLTIAGRVYTWRAASTSSANEIIIGSTVNDAISGLYYALNSPEVGTANSNVLTSGEGSSFLTIEARVAGTASNGLTVSSSVSQIVVSNLAGGVNVIPGTVATAIGQLAIITTTNASGTFRDVWTAAAISPVTLWRPPGNIKRDRTNGLLYREYYNAGLPATELAYP